MFNLLARGLLVQAANFHHQEYPNQEQRAAFIHGLQAATSMEETPFFTWMVPEWLSLMHDANPIKEQVGDEHLAYLSQPSAAMPPKYEAYKQNLAGKLEAALQCAQERGRMDWVQALLEYAEVQAKMHRATSDPSSPLYASLSKANKSYRDLLQPQNSTPLLHPLADSAIEIPRYAVQLKLYLETGAELLGQSAGTNVYDGLEFAAISSLDGAENLADLFKEINLPVGEMHTFAVANRLVNVVRSEDCYCYGIIYSPGEMRPQAFSYPHNNLSLLIELLASELADSMHLFGAVSLDLTWHKPYNNALMKYVAAWKREDWVWVGALWQYCLHNGDGNPAPWLDLCKRLQPESAKILREKLLTLSPTELITEMQQQL